MALNPFNFWPSARFENETAFVWAARENPVAKKKKAHKMIAVKNLLFDFIWNN
jgi:hypothetical protein